MQRRDFIRTLLGMGLAGWMPGVMARPHPHRRLLLIELRGGNDGLNTLIPYADPAYHRLRPRIGITREKVLQLDERLGLHPALEPLMASWESGELALVQGLGYPRPNRSHFRSIEIWETGSAAGQYLDTGWLARAFASAGRPSRPRAVVLGRGGAGVFSGPGIDSLVMQAPERFLRGAWGLAGHPADELNPALTHLVLVEERLRTGARELARGLASAGQPSGFPRHRLGRDLANAARLFRSGHSPDMIKLSHGSFDTHANQPGAHQRLLEQLAGGLAAFRASMQDAGKWNGVLVMTYSEFGRRAAENASRGTDHGTAAVHLLLGGRVKGGLYGQTPELVRLDGGDLVFTTDFRRLYASITQEWFGLGAVDGPFPPLDCIA